MVSGLFGFLPLKIFVRDGVLELIRGPRQAGWVCTCDAPRLAGLLPGPHHSTQEPWPLSCPEGTLLARDPPLHQVLALGWGRFLLVAG
jgi:hypothetical protein